MTDLLWGGGRIGGEKRGGAGGWGRLDSDNTRARKEKNTDTNTITQILDTKIN